MSSNFNKIVSKHAQARKALVEHSLSLVDKLSTGRKSRAKIRKFNVMSMWVDYIGDVIDSPKPVPAKAASNITIEVINFSGLYKGVLSIETLPGKVIPLCVTKLPGEYTSLSELYTDLAYKINNSNTESGIQPHKIKAVVVNNSLVLTLPEGAEYNNSEVSSFPPAFKITSTKALGGVSKVQGISQHSEELYERILKVLDLLAIELDITYSDEGSEIVKSLLEETSSISRGDNRINLNSRDSLSDERNRNLEL
jgi:hypothetical protein